MKKNFSIKDFTYVVFEQEELDIHNDYILNNINISYEDCNLKLILRNINNNQKLICFEFFKFSRIMVKSIKNESVIDRYIMHIGFLPKECFGQSDSFFEEDIDDYHIMIKFDEGSHISVESEKCLFYEINSNIVEMKIQ